MSVRPFSPFMAANNNFAFTHNFSSLFFWFRDIKGNKMKEVLSADIKTSRGIKCIFHPRREWHSKWGEIRSQGRMWGERVGEEVAEKRRVGVREEKVGKGRTGGLRGMWNLRGAGFGAGEGGRSTDRIFPRRGLKLAERRTDESTSAGICWGDARRHVFSHPLSASVFRRFRTMTDAGLCGSPPRPCPARAISIPRV